MAICPRKKVSYGFYAKKLTIITVETVFAFIKFENATFYTLARWSCFNISVFLFHHTTMALSSRKCPLSVAIHVSLLGSKYFSNFLLLIESAGSL